MTRQLGDIPENTHEALLLHLKRRGEMSVTDLCDLLGVTAMAVRRHLSALQQEKLVASRTVRQGRGRPTYRYHLTDEANSRLFPSGALSLTQDILEAVFDQSGHKGVMDLLTLRQDHLARKLKDRLAGKTLRQRVEEVCKFFSENGFMTDYETVPDGDFVIFQHHCAVANLAHQYRELCVLEPRLIEQLLGVTVTRQKHMLGDDLVCGYLVSAAGDSSSVNNQLRQECE